MGITIIVPQGQIPTASAFSGVLLPGIEHGTVPLSSPDITDRFITADTSEAYNRLLLGETNQDVIALGNYADMFARVMGVDGEVANIADVGAGPAHLAVRLMRKLRGGTMHVIDVSEKMLSLARTNVRREPSNIRVKPIFAKVDGQDIGDYFKPLDLDGVLARHVIHLMKDPSKFFAGAWRALKPGKVLAFSLIGHNTYNFNWPRGGASITNSQFFSRLYWVFLGKLKFALSMLQPQQIEYLKEKGILKDAGSGGVTFNPASLLPRYDHSSVMHELSKSGIPSHAVTMIVMPEYHTAQFKKAFAMQNGSIPIPGVWDIFEQLPLQARAELVEAIFSEAFPSGQELVVTEDPLFIVRKEEEPVALEKKVAGPVFIGGRTTPLSATGSRELVEDLSSQYGYPPSQVRIMDMQFAGAHLANPPPRVVGADGRLHAATLILQGDGFTFTLAETPPLSDKHAPLVTPYTIEIQDPDPEGGLVIKKPALVTYEGEPVSEFGRFSILEAMQKPPAWYFAFKNKDGSSIPSYLVINPHEQCAYRCATCSRMPYLSEPAPNYRHNTERIIREVLAGCHDPAAVKFINIVSGSQPTKAKEIEMFLYIVSAFRKAGFAEAGFGIYSFQIDDDGSMKELKENGVLTFAMTMEATDDDIRKKLYGKKGKGRLSMDDFIRMANMALQYFDYVSTNVILGHESRMAFMENMRRFATQTQSAINHFNPRAFTLEQWMMLHPEAVQNGMRYFVELNAFMEREINAGRNTFKDFFEMWLGVDRSSRFRS